MKNPLGTVLKHYILLLLLLWISGSVKAQTFHLDAQIRPRFEVRDGYQQMLAYGSTPAVFFSQRTRLVLIHETERLRIRIVPKDVRVWGDEHLVNLTGSFGDHASVDLHEAYADLQIRPGLWLAVGRQELRYDNQSLLSNRNWNQHGIASDALVIRYRSTGWQLHAGGTWNTSAERLVNNHYPSDRLKTLGFLWLNRGLYGGRIHMSAVHIATGLTESDTTNTLRFRQTSGLYARYRHRYTHFSWNTYYQYGVNQKGTPVSAWLADAELSHRFGMLTPGVGMGYLSGNQEAPSSMKTDRSFYDIHRAKHLYFGFMDYFINVPAQTNHGGLANFFWYAEWHLGAKTSLRNTVHYFRLAQINDNTPQKKHLGYENDLVFRYNFSESGVVEAGYLYFIPTSSLKTLQGIQNEKAPQFFYLMLTLTPRLFSSDW
jgi:hypothetical protein